MVLMIQSNLTGAAFGPLIVGVLSDRTVSVKYFLLKLIISIVTGMGQCLLFFDGILLCVCFGECVNITKILLRMPVIILFPAT